MLPDTLKKAINSDSVSERLECARLLETFESVESVNLLMKLLHDIDFTVANNAKLSLIKIGNDFVIDECIYALASENARVRNAAIEILHNIGVKSIPKVARLLTNKTVDIRKFAVDVLERINSVETEAPLIHALFDENLNVAAEAAVSLGKIKSKNAIPHLIEALQRETWLKCCAINALGEINGEEALEALLKIAVDEESTILFSLVVALGKIKNPRAIPRLIQISELNNPVLRPYEWESLENILRNSNQSVQNDFVEKFNAKQYLTLLQQSNGTPNKSLIYLIGICKEKSAIPILSALLSNADSVLIAAIEEAINNIGIENVTPFLEILENESETESVKLAVLKLLKGFNVKDISKTLLFIYPKVSSDLKYKILENLRNFDDDQLIPFYIDCLTTENEDLLILLIDIFEKLQDQSSIKELEKLLEHPAEIVNEKAAIALSSFENYVNEEIIVKWLNSNIISKIKIGIQLLPQKVLGDYNDLLFKLFNTYDELKPLLLSKMPYFNEPTTVEVMNTALNHENTSIRLKAIKAIPLIKADIKSEIISRVIKTDPDEWNQYQAIKVAQTLNLRELLPEIIIFCNYTTELLIAAMIDTIAHFNAAEYVAIINEYQDSDNPVLKDAIKDAFSKLKIEE